MKILKILGQHKMIGEPFMKTNGQMKSLINNATIESFAEGFRSVLIEYFLDENQIYLCYSNSSLEDRPRDSYILWSVIETLDY